MWALVKDGKIDTIYSGARAVTIDDIQYPRNMMTLYTTDEKKNIGIYDIVRKAQPDANFYNVGTSSYTYNSDADTVTEDFNVTEKNLATMKSSATNNVKHIAYTKIKHLSWLAERNVFDDTKAVPDAVKTYVAAVRSHCATICTAVDDCSNLTAYKTVHAKIFDNDGEYNTGWPDDSTIKEYERYS